MLIIEISILIVVIEGEYNKKMKEKKNKETKEEEENVKEI